ncbi:hypothetical protein BZG05_14840 [Salinivibrio kushneri]|uniref:hypothetical protein n=1 Tax=Salinivibrio kushneri TaxID=1908198 RepID=UPI000988D522|nr:hypothetical protein [Salinivibrio kushneri]OOE32279.1 hypothetical protein BZG05_14840 [Salinivibrio kushneri]
MPKKKPEPVFTKDSLKVAFERPKPEYLGIPLETDRDLYVKQIEAEYTARERLYERSIEQDLKAERNKSESERGYGAYLLGMNIEKVANVFKEYNETVKKGSPHICKQVFNCIPDYNAVASICLKTLVDGISNVTPLNSSCLYLARRIEDEINFLRLAQRSKHTAKQAEKNVKKKSDVKHKHDSLRWWVTQGAEMEWFAWSEQERMQIGNALIALVCNELKWFKVETRTVKEMGRFKKRNYLIAQANVLHWIEECRKALALKMRPMSQCMYRLWTGRPRP